MRAGKTYGTKSKMLEVRIATLGRRIQEIETAILDIGIAMDSTLVHSLPLHTPAVKRIAGLKQAGAILVAQLAALRGETINATTKSKVAFSLAEAIASVEYRMESERETLEVITTMSASRLRQGGCG